jgi:hypothetical protein
MKERGIPIRLQWTQAIALSLEMIEADWLARVVAGPKKMHPIQHLLSREKGFIHRRIQEEWKDEWTTSANGRRLRRINKTLPSIHTQRLCGSLPQN